MKIFLILVLVYVNVIEAAYDLEENDKCMTHVNGKEGICLEPKNCANFKTERNNLKICSFKQRIPVVCCPISTIDLKTKDPEFERISVTKCNEYKDKTFYGFAGGVKADNNEFPHIAAIGLRLRNGKINWFCGGSLISEKFVLSAAHCRIVDGKKLNVIRVGDQDLLVNEVEISPQEFTIKNIVVHPQYRGASKYHDIALFELSTAAILKKDVIPACLFDKLIDPTEPVEAMGYGHTSFAGEPSNELLKGTLSIADNAFCNQIYGNESSDLIQGITKQQICAWDPEGIKDTCQGDSGGPLQVSRFNSLNGRKYYIIIGITSFGKYCASKSPAVYVRVASYLDWIESVVWS